MAVSDATTAYRKLQPVASLARIDIFASPPFAHSHTRLTSDVLKVGSALLLMAVPAQLRSAEDRGSLSMFVDELVVRVVV